LIDRIRLRREAIKDSKNFTALGKMIRVNFDPAGMHRPDPDTIDHPVVSPNALGWTKDPTRLNKFGKPVDFPSLVITHDEQDLMVIPPLQPLPTITGPDFDDPSSWVPTDLPGWQAMRGNDPRTVGRMPRRYEQHYGDLTDDFIGKVCRDGSPDFRDRDTFYVLQPVNQILIHPFGCDQQKIVIPGVGFDGCRTAFLVNPYTGEAHFIGGKVHVTARIHALPAGAKA
jgi:hypothetical protein